MKQPQGGNTQTVTEETEPEEAEKNGSVVSDSGAGQTNRPPVLRLSGTGCAVQ